MHPQSQITLLIHYSGFVLLFLDSPDYSLDGSMLSFRGAEVSTFKLPE
jgi:hypothetical protein